MDEHSSLQVGPDLLWDLGYRSLTRGQVTDLLSEIYETLEFRVGTRIVERLDSGQLLKFERIVSGRDEMATVVWLNQNVPNYKAVVLDEFEYLTNTLRRASAIQKETEGYGKNDIEMAPSDAYDQDVQDQ